jgi:hypothetical protein
VQTDQREQKDPEKRDRAPNTSRTPETSNHEIQRKSREATERRPAEHTDRQRRRDK